MFRNIIRLEIGIALCMAIRMLSQVISGVYCWTEASDIGSIAAWILSLEYNLGYGIPTMIMLLIVMPVSNSSHADYGGFMALNGVKILRAGGLSDDVANSESQLHFTWGSTVSWYNSSNQYFQQNASGWQYTYLAIL